MSSASHQSSPQNRRIAPAVFLQAFLLVAAVAWVFSPALRGDWLWDDDYEITHNAVLRDPAGWWKIWLRPDLPDYFPLKTTLQWGQWHLWHEQVVFYHLTNVGLHLLSAFLIWRLFSKLEIKLAWVGALVFALHPLTVESVAWIAELKNVLSLPLLLLAMIAYLDWEGRAGRLAPPGQPVFPAGLAVPPYLKSVFFFLAAMLCKTSVVMFPVVLLLYAWWRRGRIGWSDVRASLPFFVISLGLGIVTIVFQVHRALGGMEVPLGSPLWRLGWMGRGMVFYLLKSVWPVPLMPIYPNWGDHPAWLPSVLCWIGLLGVLIWLWRRRQAHGRALLFGLGFFLLNLLPVLGLIPMSYLRISRVADHFVYLPLLGVAALAAAGFGRLRPAGLRCAAAAAVVLALASGARSYDRLFRHEEKFWAYAVKHNPDAAIAHNNYGNDLFHDDRIDAAMAEYAEAIRLTPTYAEAHNNLGNLLLNRGRTEEAMAHYRAALQAVPGYAMPHNGIGLALLRAGQAEAAVPQFQIALQTRADYPEAHYNLGLALAKMNRLDEAIAQYREAIRLRPDYPDAHTDLGNALWTQGHAEEAAQHYRAALRSRPDFTEAHYNYAVLLHQTGHWPESAAEFAAALRLRPNFAPAERNLAVVLNELGRTSEANAHQARAVQLEALAPPASPR